jgi:hypothetical protein
MREEAPDGEPEPRGGVPGAKMTAAAVRDDAAAVGLLTVDLRLAIPVLEKAQ